MKKIFVLLLTMALAYVSYADKVSDDQLARVKTIAAYHVNKLSQSDLFPDDKCPEDMNLETIKKRIENLRENLKLTEHIEASKPSSREVSDVKKYYTSKLYDDTIFSGFFNKRGRNKGDFQEKLKPEIDSVLNMRDMVEKNKEGVTEGKNDATNSTNLSDERKKGSSNFLPVLSLILAILAFGAAVYLFMELDKLKRDVDAKNYHRKESIIALEMKLAQLGDDLAKNKSQMSEMKRQVTENSDKVNSMQRNTEVMEEVVRPQSVSRGPVRQEPVVRELYAGVPSSGCFRASDTYSAKTLYRIIAKGDSIGEFEFIDRPEAVAVAQQSKTSFLDPACNVVNDDLVNFSRIVTERNGTVERTDDGWKIVKKADIRLA